MSHSAPQKDPQAPSVIEAVAAELRGPGAMCRMSEKDSRDEAADIVAALAEAGYVIVPRGLIEEAATVLKSSDRHGDLAAELSAKIGAAG